LEEKAETISSEVEKPKPDLARVEVSWLTLTNPATISPPSSPPQNLRKVSRLSSAS
jgi:hypothetical protein